MGQVLEFPTIAVVVIGTVLLVATFIRGPRPDPELAAEPLSLTVRNFLVNFLLWAGYFGVLLAVSELLPQGLALAAIAAIAVVATAGTWWWKRRHPSTPRAHTGNLSPAPAEAVAISTSDWIRALVPVLVAGAVVVAVIAMLSQVAYPR